MKKNYVELHSLRGMAALIVLSGHFLIVMPQFYSGVTVHSGWLPILFKYTPLHALVNGYGSVLLFFVLSGFVLSLTFLGNSPMTYGNYVIKRVFRILPAYWFAIIMACAIARVAPGIEDARLSDWFRHAANQPLPTFDELISHVLLIGDFDTTRINPVVWSLVHELRISLVFPLLAVFAARRSFALMLIVNLLPLPIGLLLHPISPSFAATLEYVPLFTFGILLAVHRQAMTAWFSSKRRAFRYFALIAAFLVVYYLHTSPTTPYWISVIVEYLQGAACVVLMLAALSSQTGGRVLKHRVSRFFGDISYSLYLWHVPVLLAAVKWLGAFVPLPLVMLISSSVSVLVATLSFQMIERPFTSLANAVISMRRKPVVS